MSDGGLDALMQELLQMFAVEAAEHIQTLSRTLLQLEKQPDEDERQELLNAAFRAAHSLKGSARAVELNDIERLAHESEAVLSAARSNKLEFNSDVVDVLLHANDLIQLLVEANEPPQEQMQDVLSKLKAIADTDGAPAQAQEPPPPPPPEPAKPETVVVAPKPADAGLDALMQELLQMFAVEAAEHIQTLNSALLALEKQPPDAEKVEWVNEAFRAAHSLKGSARAVELMDIEGVAHASEAVLSAARSDNLAFNSEVVDVLLDATDFIQQMVEGQKIAPEALNQVNNRLLAIADGKATPPKAVQSTPTPTPTPTPPPQPEPQPKQPPQPTAIAKPEPKAPSTRRPSVKPTSLSTGVADETIRVSVEKLDDLMAQAGELIVSKISADERLLELRDLRSLMMRWEKVWTETSELQRRIDRIAREDDEQNEWDEIVEFLNTSHRFFNQSVEKMRALDKAMTADNMRMELVTSAIQDEIRRVRMLPVETLVPTMERIVRDVARQGEKKAQLTIRGADVELDKKVLEALKDPLVHLLRNGVDHGIEAPDKRVAAGKSEAGSITVSVTQRGGNVHIIVADDGNGIDAERVKQSAIRKGLLNPAESDTIPDEEAYLLIFQAGFSTKEQVTEVSGRGVGMDVVKSQLESLQGRIQVRSSMGAGSEFHLVVPISLATIRGLIVRVGLDNYALPHHAVEKIVTIDPSTIYRVEGQPMFDLDDEPMAVIHLADVIERPREELREDRLLGIIVAGGERRMAFLVDDFVSEQAMVVKTLGKQLRRVRNVAGATLLGTGQPIVILNVTDLIKSAQGGRSVQARPIIIEHRDDDAYEAPPPRILVVDDSITTRTLERNILAGAGYDVMTAMDGVEALALLETEQFDLVVSDVEMPRIDGFELVEWIRQSAAYGDVPVVLVTSLESQENREKGLRAGANAYIVKSGFEQSELLDTIEQFI